MTKISCNDDTPVSEVKTFHQARHDRKPQALGGGINRKFCTNIGELYAVGLHMQTHAYVRKGTPRLSETNPPAKAKNRFFSPGYGSVSDLHLRARSSHTYDLQRCTAELQERGELEWACTTLAKKAFRLVLTVSAGVVLSLAGAHDAGAGEVAWPQVLFTCFNSS